MIRLSASLVAHIRMESWYQSTYCQVIAFSIMACSVPTRVRHIQLVFLFHLVLMLNASDCSCDCCCRPVRPEVLHHCLLLFHCEQLTIAIGAAGGEVLHHHRLPGAHPHRLIGRTVTVHGPSIVSMHRCYNRTGSIFKILSGYTHTCGMIQI